MMTRELSLGLVLLMLAAMMIPALAEVVKPTDSFWFYDEDNILSEATQGEIYFANKRLYEASGAEIVVVLVDSTDGMNISDYTYTLFNQWAIGGDSYRGMLVLLAIEDDDYYTMPGTAMEPFFDSSAIRTLQDTYLEPSFARKDYDQGVRRYFEALYWEVTDVLNLNLPIEKALADYKAFTLESDGEPVPEAAREESRGAKDAHGVSFGSVVLLIVMVILAIRLTTRRRFGFGRTVRPYRRTPSGSVGSSGRRTSYSRRSSGAGRSSSSSRRSFGSASRSSSRPSRGPSTRGGGAGRSRRR